MPRLRPARTGRTDGPGEGIIGKRHSTPPRTPRPGRVEFPSPAGLLTDGSSGHAPSHGSRRSGLSHVPRRLQLRGQFRFAGVAACAADSLSIPLGNRPLLGSRAGRDRQGSILLQSGIPNLDRSSNCTTICRRHGADPSGWRIGKPVRRWRGPRNCKQRAPSHHATGPTAGKAGENGTPRARRPAATAWKPGGELSGVRPGLRPRAPPDSGDAVGVARSSNLCTEITFDTGPDEVAVCNLGSVDISGRWRIEACRSSREQETGETPDAVPRTLCPGAGFVVFGRR